MIWTKINDDMGRRVAHLKKDNEMTEMKERGKTLH